MVNIYDVRIDILSLKYRSMKIYCCCALNMNRWLIHSTFWLCVEIMYYWRIVFNLILLFCRNALTRSLLNLVGILSQLWCMGMLTSFFGMLSIFLFEKLKLVFVSKGDTSSMYIFHLPTTSHRHVT